MTCATMTALAALLASLVAAQPAGAAPSLDEGAAPPLSLERAVELADAVAADVVTAREDVVLVDAEYLAARAVILPRVDLTATAGGLFLGARQEEDPAFVQFCNDAEALANRELCEPQGASSNPYFTLGLQLTQLVYDGGRWWNQLARVEDVAASRKATVERLRRDLRLRVAQAFYGHEAALQAATAVEAQVMSDERQLTRARDLVEAGRAKAADVAAAARNLAQDRSERARKRLSVRQSAHALNVLIGRPSYAPISLAVPADLYTTTATVVVPPLDALIDQALRHRPDLLGLEAEQRAAERAIDIAAADYLPNVSLSASYRKQSRVFERVYGDPTDSYQAGLDVVVKWNLFEGLGTDARVAQAESAARKLVARRAELLRTVEGEVADKAAALGAQVELVSLSEQAIAAADEAVRLAQGLYDEGRGTLLEVRDAELQVLQARLSGITARLDREIAREALARALGTTPSALRDGMK